LRPKSERTSPCGRIKRPGGHHPEGKIPCDRENNGGGGPPPKSTKGPLKNNLNLPLRIPGIKVGNQKVNPFEGGKKGVGKKGNPPGKGNPGESGKKGKPLGKNPTPFNPYPKSHISGGNPG